MFCNPYNINKYICSFIPSLNPPIYDVLMEWHTVAQSQSELSSACYKPIKWPIDKKYSNFGLAIALRFGCKCKMLIFQSFYHASGINILPVQKAWGVNEWWQSFSFLFCSSILQEKTANNSINLHVNTKAIENRQWVRYFS